MSPASDQSTPTENDATLHEARHAGATDPVAAAESGDAGPTDPRRPRRPDAAPPRSSRLAVDRERTRACSSTCRAPPKATRGASGPATPSSSCTCRSSSTWPGGSATAASPTTTSCRSATIGLIKSVDRFDLDRGVEFSTYATPTIVGEIKRHFRDKGWAVRVPAAAAGAAALAGVGDRASSSQKQGRAPTVAELAARLKITDEEVLEGLESANAYSTLSLDAGDSGSDDEPMPVLDTLGVEDEALEGVEYRESLKPLLEQLAAAGEDRSCCCGSSRT